MRRGSCYTKKVCVSSLSSGSDNVTDAAAVSGEASCMYAFILPTSSRRGLTYTWVCTGPDHHPDVKPVAASNTTAYHQHNTSTQQYVSGFLCSVPALTLRQALKPVLITHGLTSRSKPPAHPPAQRPADCASDHLALLTSYYSAHAGGETTPGSIATPG